VILAEGKNQVKRITLFWTYYSNTSCLSIFGIGVGCGETKAQK
jgi:hypothetical protein